MIEKLKNMFKVQGWQLSFDNDKFTVYKTDKNGDQNPYETYIADFNNIYRFYQGKMIPVVSFGSLENNIIGMYCMINNSRVSILNKVAADVKNVRSASSFEDVKSIFLKYVDLDYLNSNLNLGSNYEIDGAFNLSIDGEWLAIDYLLGDYYLSITEVNSYNELYAQLLPHLLMKKQFSDEIFPLFTNNNFHNKNLLEFYSLYSNGTLTYAKEKKNKIK